MRKTLLAAAMLIGSMSASGHAGKAERNSSVPPAARAIIDHLNMQNIPHEGPWFLQTQKSDDIIEGTIADRYKSKRNSYSAIYLIMTQRDYSAMHRLETDELWHFYGGNPAIILLLYPDGRGETKIWGNDILKGQEPQIMVPRGTWMGARPIGDPETAYSFGGNTLTPGFEYEDYEPGYRDELIKRYPKFAAQIIELTREESAARPTDAQKENAEPAPVAVEQLVGRQAPQQSTAISTARFTLQKGASIPRTITHQGHEVMIVTAGRGRVTIGGKEQNVRQGSVVYLPPKIPHSINADSLLEFYVAVSPAWQQSDMETGS